MKKKIVLFFLIFFLLATNIYAIDTRDWEWMSFPLFSAKPEKEWLQKTTFMVLNDFWGQKGQQYEEERDGKKMEKFYDEDSNSITVPISNNWHDLTEFKVFYFKAEMDGYVYGLSYKFTKGSFTILDVLEKYGTELAEIKIMEDLSKEIVYTLKHDTPLSMGEDPLINLRPAEDPKEITLIIFRSKDRVFIDDLVILTGPK